MQRPKNLQSITDPSVAEKVLKFLENIEESPDVQKVYANLYIPEEVLKQIK
jgi:transcriptional/translational regulatory protein YebC/TACO1